MTRDELHELAIQRTYAVIANENKKKPNGKKKVAIYFSTSQNRHVAIFFAQLNYKTTYNNIGVVLSWED